MSKARDIANSTETLDVDGGTIKLDGNYPVGTGNVALGDAALDSNVSGASNTAIGSDALTANTTAEYNTAVGYQAGYSTNTGVNNTFMGEKAGYSNTTSDRSSYYGSLAGNATTGRANTFIGCDAGYLVTTGANNTILGRYSGNNGGLDIRTSSNNIVLSDGDGNPKLYITGANSDLVLKTGNTTASLASFWTTYSGYNGVGVTSRVNRTSSTGYYFFNAYDDAASAYKFYVQGDGNVYNVSGTYGSISDQRLKENIIDASSQWEDIKALKVRKYSYISDNLDMPNQIGVIAQELEEAGMSGLVQEVSNRDENNLILDTTTKQVKYSILYMKAVKALQEAMERIETLEAKVTALENV